MCILYFVFWTLQDLECSFSTVFYVSYFLESGKCLDGVVEYIKLTVVMHIILYIFCMIWHENQNEYRMIKWGTRMRMSWLKSKQESRQIDKYLNSWDCEVQGEGVRMRKKEKVGESGRKKEELFLLWNIKSIKGYYGNVKRGVKEKVWRENRRQCIVQWNE